MANDIMGMTFKVELSEGFQNQTQQPKEITKNSSDESLQGIILLMYLETTSARGR